MAKMSLRDYCRRNLNGQYRIKDAEADETVVLRGDPAKFTPEALAQHAEEKGIKSVKFPVEAISGTKEGRATYGACSGKAASDLMVLWLDADEDSQQPAKAPPVPNGRGVTVTAK